MMALVFYQRKVPLLFRKFAELSNKPKTRESSTKVGLYTAMKLASRIGCELSFQHNNPKGSIFTVSISKV